jgi:hypothetical protein
VLKVQSVVVLEWQFSPADYFEEPDEIVREGYELSISVGKIEARIDAAFYDTDLSLRQKLDDELNARSSVLNW